MAPLKLYNQRKRNFLLMILIFSLTFFTRLSAQSEVNLTTLSLKDPFLNHLPEYTSPDKSVTESRGMYFAQKPGG